MKTIVALETTMNLPVRVNLDERYMTMNIYAFHNHAYSSSETITIDKAVDEITSYVDYSGEPRKIIFPHIVDTPVSRNVFPCFEKSIRDGVFIPFSGPNETRAELVMARGADGKRMLLIDRDNGLVAYRYGSVAVGEDLELETWEHNYAEFTYKAGTISGFQKNSEYLVYQMDGEAVVSELQREKIQMVIAEVTDYRNREMSIYDINVAHMFISKWYAEQMIELAQIAGFDTDNEIFNFRKTECF